MKTTKYFIGALLGCLPIVSAGLTSPTDEWRSEHCNGVNELQSMNLATSEFVEAATLAPDGLNIAILSIQDAQATHDLTGHPTQLVEIWNLAGKRLIAHRVLNAVPDGVANENLIPQQRAGDRFVRYSADGSHLLVYDGESLVVLRGLSSASGMSKDPAPKQLEEAKRISLKLGPPKENTIVQTIEVSPDGSRVAISICNPLQNSGNTVRIYSLLTGEILRKWDFDTGCIAPSYYPLAWDPTGNYVAISLPLFPGGIPRPLSLHRSKKKDLLIMDVNSGAEFASIHSGFIVGPVCFTTQNTVIAASLNADPSYFADDTIREWSIPSGKLIREIKGPPQGIHTLLALSKDGRIIFGYTGMEKQVENFLDNDFLEFSLWDYKTGKSIGSSGHIMRPRPSSPLEKELGEGYPAFGSGKDRITPNDRGNGVLVWWQESTRPFVIYTIPQSMQP